MTLPGIVPNSPQPQKHPSTKDVADRAPLDPQLINEDIAPLKKQTWGSYNIFAFWMSDVHSVGGYVTAGSLFALGLSSWQVLLALLVGIGFIYVMCNLVSLPSQRTGTPFPVVCRAAFGVYGAKLPAMIRGLIAVAWYGIQTYLASHALVVFILKIQPEWGSYADVGEYGFLGLSLLGYIAFAILWVAQALVFWRGMETIRKFIDFCGPAVYVVMFLLAIYMIQAAGWESIHFSLSDTQAQGWAAVSAFGVGVATVVSYFSGPMLNFGDISRYGKTQEAVKRGNLLGLPLNFLIFSILVVVTASATVPVYGELITDPVDTIAAMDNTFAIVFGALTLIIATIGINIVANFIAPAFDFSNVAPTRISWRTGGMIAAIGSIFLTPWNLYNSPEVIHYTLDTLAAFIGPLFGVLIAFFYVIHRGDIDVPSLYSSAPTAKYYYRNGVNPNALWATAFAALLSLSTVLIPALHVVSAYSWFIGAGLAASIFISLERIRPSMPVTSPALRIAPIEMG
ncbi:MAG: NCS1 family nucleobase:cation symporter-1 [Corynebacterium sp.]|nr:NCS1 family nucleobase:cation symporter-1 [Corynebacterium sp.]